MTGEWQSLIPGEYLQSLGKQRAALEGLERMSGGGRARRPLCSIISRQCSLRHAFNLVLAEVGKLSGFREWIIIFTGRQGPAEQTLSLSPLPSNCWAHRSTGRSDLWLEQGFGRCLTLSLAPTASQILNGEIHWRQKASSLPPSPCLKLN